MRLTYEGKNRITTRPDSFTLKNWYIVGDMNPASAQKFDDLLADQWSEVPQKVSDLRGRTIGTGAEAPQTDEDPDLSKGYLAGFTIRFNSKAKDKNGQVVVGNGQVRLVVASDENEENTLALHPVAVVTNVEDPTKTAYARFRYNADSTFTSSVGGASEAIMAFEFPVPAGFRPLALYIKGVRVDLSEREQPTTKFSSPSDRDAAIDGGTMAEMTDVGPKVDDQGKPIQAPETTAAQIDPLVARNALGFAIQKGTEQSLSVAMEGRTWSLVEGDQKFSVTRIKGLVGVDQKLKIDKFQTDDSTAVVQMNVTPIHHSAEFNRLWESADRNAEPALVDKNGTRYTAAGWVYHDASIWWVRYFRGNPIQKLNELPAVSRSSASRELTLVFVVSAGVEITEFRLGDTTVFTPTKPILANAASRR
jgi:hypothetical protein